MGNMNGNAEYHPPQNYGTKGSHMAKSKSSTKKPLVGGGAKGGSGHMFGKQTVGTKTPGITGKAQSGGGGKFAKGGGTGKVGKQGSVKTSRPGVSK